MGRRVQLHRALSKMGICSRVQGWDKVTSGSVRINGKVCLNPLQWVDLDSDIVKAETSIAASVESQERTVIALNKPRGYVTTRSDERGCSTVYDLLPIELKQKWLFPVGRLDKESEGLLLMTDDGELSEQLTTPCAHVTKSYSVRLSRLPRFEDIDSLCCGVQLDTTTTRPCTIVREHGNWFRVDLCEGRNRQIRRMFNLVGCKVKRLVRVSIGELKLDDLQLKPGQVRTLLEHEISKATSRHCLVQRKLPQ